MSVTDDNATLRMILAHAPGHHTALIAPESDRRWTYDALGTDVERLSSQLESIGVGHSDRVAIVLPNGPEIVAAFLAIVHGGRVAAPLIATDSTYDHSCSVGHSRAPSP